MSNEKTTKSGPVKSGPVWIVPVLAALVAVGSGGAALAGGLGTPTVEAPVVAPAPAPVYQRGGGDWTGAWVGANLGYGHAKAGPGNSGNGAVYGLSAGYDRDFGTWVAGVGLDWDATNIDLNTGNDKLKDIARLKFRVGADLGRTMVYATAGPARAQATLAGVKAHENGWFGGIGVDYALTSQWTLGGEVLTNQFNNFNGSGTDLKATTATMNLGFRF